MIGAVVIVKVKKKIKFHSKLQKFGTFQEKKAFVDSLIKKLKEQGYKDTEIHTYTVSDEPEECEEVIPRGKVYCPYCGEINKFKQGEFGSAICPICGISEQDFYLRKYNKKK